MTIALLNHYSYCVLDGVFFMYYFCLDHEL